MPQRHQNVRQGSDNGCKTKKMDKVTETQARLPAWNPIPSDWSDDEDESDKDDQARAPIAKPILQDPKPSTSFGTYSSETLPKVETFRQGKITPLGNRTLTIGCRCGIQP